MPQNDVTADIYQILDESGLTATEILTSKKPLITTVNAMRGEIVRQVAAYITKREQEKKND